MCSAQDRSAARDVHRAIFEIMLASFSLWKSWQGFRTSRCPVSKKRKIPVRWATKISTVHLFVSNLTRAFRGLPSNKIPQGFSSSSIQSGEKVLFSELFVWVRARVPCAAIVTACFKKKAQVVVADWPTYDIVDHRTFDRLPSGSQNLP
jgi:hypothetical protein